MGLQADWLWKSRGCRGKPITSRTGYGCRSKPISVRQAMGTRNMVLGTNNTPRASIPRGAHRDSLA